MLAGDGAFAKVTKVIGPRETLPRQRYHVNFFVESGKQKLETRLRA